MTSTDPDTGYELIAVEAEVGICAWGPTLAAAFAQAAAGVFARIVDPERVDARDSRDVRAQGDSIDALLVTWINECLYVHEIEGFVVRRVEVDTCDGGLVHGTLLGEDLDRDRHLPGLVIKAATRRGIEVAHAESRWTVRVLLET
jgi:SHS2 domain-containing protein